MTSYSLEDLQEALDKNLYWRKKELTTLKSTITSSNGSELNTFIRAGIAILYAHWEGFIKISAREYLNYLNCLEISCNTMKDNFITLALKSTIVDAAKQSNKSISHHKIINELLYNSTKKFKVKYKEKLIIDTESNLSYTVLEDILFSLGFDKKDYELKKNYIKDMLVEDRNKIAHGEYLSLVNNKLEDPEKNAKENFEDLYKVILGLMELFKTQIIESSLNKLYLKDTC